MDTNRVPNRLIGEKSPYLLQHAHNPVDWYPWGDEAFKKAKEEDKPLFLSIGYSTCHWCHVMARECFEDAEVAKILNRFFVSIKVDREQRPDIDGIYMRACQSMTGSGGWPLSIFMDADGNPFFAGTYFPKSTFISLLNKIADIWQYGRQSLLENGKKLTSAISKAESAGIYEGAENAPVKKATEMFKETFDAEYGGFGNAPKFPSAHNIMFLLRTAPDMAELTLKKMYLGGIFDHIGGGFSRYSTDRYWLVPHFEKMLYDNALLAMAYSLAYETTGKPLYRTVAERVFTYIERDMHCPDGGFYSAQDADSESGEGSFYLFTPDEIEKILGASDGKRFCKRYGITDDGNFEGKNIPNLLNGQGEENGSVLEKVYEYRKKRMPLYTDTKILTAWNALTAAAYAVAARIFKEDEYLKKGLETIKFIEREFTGGDTVFSGKAENRRSGPGFIDDYAFYIFALIQMYRASFDKKYLDRASKLTEKVLADFWDEKSGGFFFTGKGNEELIARLKETMDSATPSGNSVMAYNLSRLYMLTESEKFENYSEKQRKFMNGEVSAYPAGYGFYLYTELPVKKVICALKNPQDIRSLKLSSDNIVSITESRKYPVINDKTTYYVCNGNACLPPTNML